MSDEQTYQCPNVDCDNCNIYKESELPPNKRCYNCHTVLEIFSYVTEEEQEEMEEMDELEGYDDEYYNDTILEDLED